MHAYLNSLIMSLMDVLIDKGYIERSERDLIIEEAIHYLEDRD